MKIKNVAVTFQNKIQYDSFINAVDLMLKNNINVDIYVPKHTESDGFDKMFDEFYTLLKKKEYKTFRELTDIEYDILFMPYIVEPFNKLKRKYTIKYMYGLSTKSKISMGLLANYIFDGFLCYGKEDSIPLSNYGYTFQIGNIKYLNEKKLEKSNSKKTLLYLPTYGDLSSIELVIPELTKMQSDYNILIKPHHCTEYLANEDETRRKNKIYTNFPKNKIFSSKYPIEDLINQSDLIITDLSGAIFDAICLKKSVVVYTGKGNDHDKYGNFVSIPIKYANLNYFPNFKDFKNHHLDYYIKEGLSSKMKKNVDILFSKLFYCQNSESGVKFLEFIKDLEDGKIIEEYKQIHDNVRDEISDLYNYKNTYLEINKNLIALKKEKNELIKQNNNLKNEIDLLYSSTSWKITKPLRNVKKIIKQIFKK